MNKESVVFSMLENTTDSTWEANTVYLRSELFFQRQGIGLDNYKSKDFMSRPDMQNKV